MALNFQSTIKTNEGIEVANAYGRVFVSNPEFGNQLNYGVSIYSSEQAFLDGADAIHSRELTLSAAGSYDYDTDSKDILDLAHDAMISVLAAQGITATKDLV